MLWPDAGLVDGEDVGERAVSRHRRSSAQRSAPVALPRLARARCSQPPRVSRPGVLPNRRRGATGRGMAPVPVRHGAPDLASVAARPLAVLGCWPLSLHRAQSYPPTSSCRIACRCLLARSALTLVVSLCGLHSRQPERRCLGRRLLWFTAPHRPAPAPASPTPTQPPRSSRSRPRCSWA